MMERQAKCLCGQLKVTVRGEPALSMVCNCTNCQRRTGSVFGAITYFHDTQVIQQSGQALSYRFKVDSGNTNQTFFCPECGTTVYFKADMFNGQTGIAAGCFNDPDLPEPGLAVWTNSKTKWVNFPEGWHDLPEQVPVSS